MGRYRGETEQARRDLRDMGASASEARKTAPRLADVRRAAVDAVTPPFSWAVGCTANEKPLIPHDEQDTQ